MQGPQPDGSGVRARIDQCLPSTALLRFFLYPLAGRAQIELHAGSDLLALEYCSRGGEVFEARIDARNQIRLLDRHPILLNLSERLHHLHGIRPGDMGSHLRQVERNSRRV